MKEVSGSTCNVFFAENDKGEFFPLIEAILIVSEPVYRVDQGGSIVKIREVESVRFFTSPGGLRALAASFLEWADDAEKSEHIPKVVNAPKNRKSKDGSDTNSAQE